MKSAHSSVAIFGGWGLALALAMAVTALAEPGEVRTLPQPPASPERVTGNRLLSRAAMEDLAGEVTPSLDQIGALKRHLELLRQLAVVQMAGSKARVESAEQAIKEMSAAVEKEVAEDEAIAAYKLAMAGYQEELKAMHARPSMASPRELDNMAYQIADIKAKMAERRELIRGRSHNGALCELERQRIDATMAISEEQAMITSIDGRLAKLGGTADKRG